MNLRHARKVARVVRQCCKDNPTKSESELLEIVAAELASDGELMSDDQRGAVDWAALIETIIKLIQFFMTLFANPASPA